MMWRVGEHYGIHVYEGDRPVGTFHTVEDARKAVLAVNRLEGQLCGERAVGRHPDDADRTT